MLSRKIESGAGRCPVANSHFTRRRLDLRRYIPTPRSCRFCTVKFVSFGVPAAVLYLSVTDSVDHQMLKATTLCLSK